MKNCFKGMNSLNKKVYDKAIDYFNQAIELNTNDPDFYYNKAECLRVTAKYKEADLSYNEVIRLDRNYSDAYNSKGLISYYLSNYVLV